MDGIKDRRVGRYYPNNVYKGSTWQLNVHEKTYLSTDRNANLMLWRGDSPFDPLYVENVDPTTIVNWYNEVTDLTYQDDEREIMSYTVPNSVRMHLGSLYMEGNADGQFTLKINGVTYGKYRITPSQQSLSVNFTKYPLVTEEGDVIKIFVKCSTVRLIYGSASYSLQAIGCFYYDPPGPSDISGFWGLFKVLPNIVKTNDSILLNVDHDMVIVNATTSDIVVTLPSAVGLKGKHYIIKRVDDNPNFKVEVMSINNIDNKDRVEITKQYLSYTIISDGENWWIV